MSPTDKSDGQAASSGNATLHPLDRYSIQPQSSDASTDKSPYYKPSAPTITLPKGGGALKGIDEKFSVNAVNGTAALEIPLPLTPGRGGFTPALSLSYNSGGGNSEFGLGWGLGLPSISRKTDKHLPRYNDADDSDTFLFAGTEDLIPALKEDGGEWIEDENLTGGYLIRRYRPRIEGLFARIEYIQTLGAAAGWWRVTTKDNITTYYGLTAAARLADPTDPARIARWLPQLVVDGKGNAQMYEYMSEDLRAVPASLHEAARQRGLAPFANTYLKRVKWCNHTPFPFAAADVYQPALPAAATFLMEAVLDYGDHPGNVPSYTPHPSGPECRNDPFSDYRYGFEVRTYRKCRRVLMFHRFRELNDGVSFDPHLVRALTLTYAHHGAAPDALVEADFITSAVQTGYKQVTVNGTTEVRTESLPPLTLAYESLQWSSTVKEVDDEDWEGALQGLSGPYQWIDLWGEGLPGILHEAAGGGWHYKQNEGDGRFTPALTVAEKPSFAGLGASLQWQDLDADGRSQLVSYEAEYSGYFELDDDGEWQGFTPFRSRAQVDWDSPYTKLLDLDGDGRPDLLLTDDGVWTGFKNTGTKGYVQGGQVPTLYDEEKGPRLVFADAVQQVFLADMSGDGLTDLVRILNGSVSYWPNLGYGRFGAKVSMSDAPRFDFSQRYNPRFLQLADISGTGAADLIYLADGTFRAWINQSGNGWSAAKEIAVLPEAAPENSVAVLDFLGLGTGCIVWNSPLPQHSRAPLRYVDLMGGKKPYLMKSYANGLGKEVTLNYRSSTKYYLADRTAGTPWATKLPFPVQCLAEITTTDAVSETAYTQHYTYRHGYYDHAEREFRGFGRVDAVDTDSAAFFDTGTTAANDLDQAPVLTKTWYHTGAWMREGTLLEAFEEEYYDVPGSTGLSPMVGASLPAGLSAMEEREAYRALKGSPLRQEVYALDGTDKESIPYTVAAHTYRTRLVQPASFWEDERRPASFFTHAEEALTWSCERHEDDARLAQELTLEVDRWGNVLKSAQVAYPRTPAGLALVADLPVVQDAQAKMHITASETVYTADILGNALYYRLRLPCEAASYELRGFIAPAGRWTATALKTALSAASEVDYSDTGATSGLCKRLLSRSRTLYRPDNGTATSLALGTLQPLALPYEQYILAMTAGINATAYDSAIGTSMMDEGGYVIMDGWCWWIPSGVAHFDAGTTATFFTPTRYTDPWGNSTTISYWEDYWLLPLRTTDAVKNVTTIERYDWRSLQAERILDPNNNITEALYSPLGLPVAVAGMGKGDGSEGDTLTGLDPGSGDDFSRQLLFWSNSADEENTLGLLGGATWRCVYDFDAQPTAVAIIAREWHVAEENIRGEASPLLTRFTYTDGFGRMAMHKAQAAPNPDDPNNPRWVGSGKMVYNNKGKAVLQYEPYFSPTHAYDPALQAAEWGHSPRIQYDPLGRAWKTEAPDGTFSYTEWDGWSQTVWDANDTVTQSPWYAVRTGTGPLASDPEEADAAAKATQHAATPVLMHLDTLGRPLYTIQHNRYPDTGVWIDEHYHSYEDLDITGARLAVHDARGLVPLQCRYNMVKAPAYQESVDGGSTRMLLDAAGQPLYGWDADGRQTHLTYDALRRPLAKECYDPATSTTKVLERMEYGEGQGNDTVLNLRGQLYRTYDGAGLVEMPQGYDFKGTPRETHRFYTDDYTTHPDWTNPSAVALDGKFPHVTALRADAFGRPVSTTAPDDSVTYYTYDRGGALYRLDVHRSGQGWAIASVLATEYDAKGRRTRIQYANNTSTRYEYDPLTYRLTRLTTARSTDSAVLQDLCYWYDPAGNITCRRDEAQQTVFFNNSLASPENDYTYDALYRLVIAGGREHAGQNAPDSWNDYDRTHLPHTADEGAMQNYIQYYRYDAVGNMLEMRHTAGVGQYQNYWTRTFEIDGASSRLLATSGGSDSEGGGLTYDARGNLVRGMKHLSPYPDEQMHYNESNRLETVWLSDGRRAYYQYDGSGQRVRKTITNDSNQRTEERKYVGELWERYTQWDSGVTLIVRRETLHLMDDRDRVALIDTRTEGSGDGEPWQLIRYQYADHLGSASLEVDESSKIISYEEYYPYGTTSFQSGRTTAEVSLKRYRYTGKERDEETGLNYHGARYYAPWLARWCAVDPMQGERSWLSPYNYCQNNPINRTDPTGKIDRRQKNGGGSAGGVIGAAAADTAPQPAFTTGPAPTRPRMETENPGVTPPPSVAEKPLDVQLPAPTYIDRDRTAGQSPAYKAQIQREWARTHAQLQKKIYEEPSNLSKPGTSFLIVKSVTENLAGEYAAYKIGRGISQLRNAARAADEIGERTGAFLSAAQNGQVIKGASSDIANSASPVLQSESKPLYRVIRTDENITEGLIAKNPSASYSPAYTWLQAASRMSKHNSFQ